MNSFMIFGGRVKAETIDKAKELIKEKLFSKNLMLLDSVNPYPCQVQHMNGVIWWEYYAKVKEVS